MVFSIILNTMLLTLIISLIFICSLFRDKNGLPTNWPFVGMLPALLKNSHRLHDYVVEVFEKTGMTFEFKGPWFTKMHIIATADPANIHHIMSKRFENYVKGYKLYEIMDVLGDGILNTDFDVWDYHRNVALSFFNHPNFHPSLIQTALKKVKNGLIPVLDHASKHELEIDLQDVFLRFMYDTSSTIMMNHDPNSLSIDLSYFPLLKVVADLEHVILYRHVVPTCMWKFMRWLNVGVERKQNRAWKTLDEFIYKQIYRKRDEKKQEDGSMQEGQDIEVRLDLLTLFMDNKEIQKTPLTHNANKNTTTNNNNNNNNNNDNNNYKFLRDAIANFFLAGGETISTALSWFFYLLSKNPQVVHKIKAELQVNMIQINNNCELFLRNFEEINGKLIYLHAALCETLRLYPSIPFNPKQVIESDILPSGHCATPNTQLITTLYVMGRMKSVWGDDCNDFKPERWIEKGGKIKHEPSYKFSVFGAGPRTCVGKQMAFTQMKIVAATIIQNYHIEVIEQYHVPDVSMVSRVKNGFKVKMHPYLE